MRRGTIGLAVVLALAGCSHGGGTDDGLRTVLATAAPSSTLTLEQVQRVCGMGRDDLVDAVALLAQPGIEDAERAMQAGLDYSCPDRGKEFAEMVQDHREAMGDG